MDGNYSDRFSSVESGSDPEEASTELLSKVIESHLREHEKVWKPRSLVQCQSKWEKTGPT
jgi:hypothetical protein